MALINGKVYDWNSVTINVSGMENIELQEISYDDEQEVDPVYGKGGKIRGYGTGNQKNSVKLSMLREDFNEMTRVIKSKGYKNFYKYMVPKITVSYLLHYHPDIRPHIYRYQKTCQVNHQQPIYQTCRG